MPKSTIRCLIISISLVAMFVGCASDLMKGFTKSADVTPVFDVVYFLDAKTDYVYKANITVYGKTISGIFIAKRINDNAHRVLFTTEFGNKLLDFEISDANFKVNFIVDELNKKMFVNTLREDLALLLRPKFAVQSQYENENDNVLQSQNGKRVYHLFLSKSNEKLYKISQSSTRKQKLYITYESENNIFAERIIIQHQNIDLKIEFNHLKTNSN